MSYWLLFPKEEYTEPPSGAIMFERTQNNFEYLVAALLGAKYTIPGKRKMLYGLLKNRI